MMRSRSFQLIHNSDVEEKIAPKFPVLRGSFGADICVLAKDREILTNPEETKRRRAIRLLRNNDKTWGFTLQTYGIRNKRTGEIDIMTYVDYVELHSPAWRAGMQQGDIILSVNGESVENASHHDLVSKIKKSGFDLRLVVLFENCCTKVDLHERYLKLKKLVQLKMKELHHLEEEEKKLKGGTFFSRKDFLRHSSTSSLCSDWDTYSERIYLPHHYIPNKIKFDLLTCESSSTSFHPDDISNKNYRIQAEASLKESCSTHGEVYMYTNFASFNNSLIEYNISETYYSPNKTISIPKLGSISDDYISTKLYPNVSDQSCSSEYCPVTETFDIPYYTCESKLKAKCASNNSSRLFESVKSLDKCHDITYEHFASSDGQDTKKNLLAHNKKFEDGILVNDATLSSRL